MSMLARRSLIRALPRTRGYAGTAGEVAKTNWAEKQAALKSHAAGVHHPFSVHLSESHDQFRDC